MAVIGSIIFILLTKNLEFDGRLAVIMLCTVFIQASYINDTYRQKLRLTK